MKIGLQLGYWGANPPPGSLEAVQAAEEMGFDSLWTGEAWGSDALSHLTWFGAHTSRMTLGTTILQLSARTPTATAMAALTLDHLSGGRFICGLGVSGPQVVEGWYGQPFSKPLARTREYIDIMRQVFAREGPVTNDGPHYPLPLSSSADGSVGKGKALRSITHPLRADLPIYLAAEGPKNLQLAGEIADGWLPIWMSPNDNDFYKSNIEKGFEIAAANGLEKSWDTFGVAATVPSFVHHDVDEAIDLLRPNYALYIGGMGAPDENYHYSVFARMGYEDECAEIQRLYLAGEKDKAAQVVPAELIDDVALVGPPERIQERITRWEETVVDTLLIGGPWEIVREVGKAILQ